jgi:hypothetical protein
MLFALRLTALHPNGIDIAVADRVPMEPGLLRLTTSALLCCGLHSVAEASVATLHEMNPLVKVSTLPGAVPAQPAVLQAEVNVGAVPAQPGHRSRLSEVQPGPSKLLL